jgi:zinc and cadmium transporter
MTNFFIIVATLFGSLFSLIGAFALANAPGFRSKFLMQLTAFAAGVMLATSLLHLGPEAGHEGLSTQQVFITIFVAIVFFFILEKVIWFHHHHDTGSIKPASWLILIGDTIHNFIDGVAIASAFLIDPWLGVITTAAVALHEIPQEMADFIALLKQGVPTKKAMLYNVFSSLSAVFGAVITVAFVGSLESVLPYIIAFSAGMFLYISLSDLIPELHHHQQHVHNSLEQLVWFLLGVALLYGVSTATHQLIPHSEEEHYEKEIHLENEPPDLHE